MTTSEKYSLPIFEDTDIVDLVEYSEKMAEALEKAVDDNKYDDTKVEQDISVNTSNIIKLQEENKRQKNEIECLKENQLYGEAEGKNIYIDDSSNNKPKSINVYGESRQEGEPSPDNTIPIQNITGNVDVKVCGKNLCDDRFSSYNVSGAYGYIQLVSEPTELITSIIDNDTTVDMSGIYFGYTYSGSYTTGGYVWFMNRGDMTSDQSKFKTNKYRYFSFFPNNEATFNKIFSRYKIQIEKATNGQTEATDYEPYTEQTVTFPLGDEKLMEGSYLASDGIHHKRKQTVLDGSENWKNYTPISGNIAQVALTFVAGSRTALANKFKVKLDYSATEHINIALNAIFVHIDKTRLATEDIAGFKAWLTENPICLEYELAEEEIVEYAEEQQEAWNKIEELVTYKNVTNISSNANLKIKYVKDLETVINNLQSLILEV